MARAKVFHRYEQDTKLAVYYAVVLTSHRGEPSITPEDLLIGLTWRQHAPDCEFRHLKEAVPEIWAAVGVAHLPQTSVPYVAPGKKPPLNDAAKRVLAYTAKEADADGLYWIDIDHILRGILREGGSAADALSQAGWTVERIKAAAEIGRQKYPPKPAPLLARWRGELRWALIGFVIALLLGAFAYMRSQDPERPASTSVQGTP